MQRSLAGRVEHARLFGGILPSRPVMSDVDALIAKIESLTPAQAARRRDAYLKMLHDSRGSLRLLKSMFIMIADFEPLSWAAGDADDKRENDEDSHALVNKLLDCTRAAMTAAE